MPEAPFRLNDSKTVQSLPDGRIWLRDLSVPGGSLGVTYLEAEAAYQLYFYLARRFAPLAHQVRDTRDPPSPDEPTDPNPPRRYETRAEFEARYARATPGAVFGVTHLSVPCACDGFDPPNELHWAAVLNHHTQIADHFTHEACLAELRSAQPSPAQPTVETPGPE